MGLFSTLIGGNEGQKAVQEALIHIRRMIEDEQFQLEMLDPILKQTLEGRPAYDRDPKGTGSFGFTETNPIPVNGWIGEVAYLSKLETVRGERILFHRIGSINAIDVFEAVTFSGSEWFILFADLYHPRRSRLTPNGFRFTKELGQFSGFHMCCSNFPYDFIEMKQAERKSGLSMAYIPINKVEKQLKDRVFQRPLAHKAKLHLVRSRLSLVML